MDASATVWSPPEDGYLLSLCVPHGNSGGATAVTTSYVGKIITATYTSDYVNLLACWSRYFPESVLDGYIGVGYSLFYYLLLMIVSCFSEVQVAQRNGSLDEDSAA